MKRTKVAVIGGGAAGFFAAINCAEALGNAEVSIFEKSNKFLSKVRISGGGRCNVAHYEFDASRLLNAYPRGKSMLKKLFSRFGPKEIIDWFENRGVKLKVEADGRMFPATDTSETIINCFLHEADRYGVNLYMQKGVTKIVREAEQFRIYFSDDTQYLADKVIVAIGGHPNLSPYAVIKELEHELVLPLPSLFTFNIPKRELYDLAGVSVPNARVKIQSTKYVEEGPLLITHWGLSGPAVLKLSAFAARDLNAVNYRCKLSINWIWPLTESMILTQLEEFRQAHPKKLLSSVNPFKLPGRLWLFLLQETGVDEDLQWVNFSGRLFNKLLQNLSAYEAEVNGKSTFKEEFVNCGGLDLSELNFDTMESKRCKDLYFAGEVVDADGITGGYNFMNAWTTAWTAAKSIALSVKK